MSSNQRGEFSRVLNDLRGGLVAIQLSKELERLIESCQENGGKGKLTLTLDLTPKGKQNREIHVVAKVAVKAPTNPDLEERSIFYAQRGQLTRNDPDQHTIPGLRGVDNSDPHAADNDDERRTGTHRD